MSQPWASPRMSPARKESPAPVVSTTGIQLSAGTISVRRKSVTKQPRLPSLMPNAFMPNPLMQVAISSGVFLPVMRRASSMLGKNTSVCRSVGASAASQSRSVRVSSIAASITVHFPAALALLKRCSSPPPSMPGSAIALPKYTMSASSISACGISLSTSFEKISLSVRKCRSPLASISANVVEVAQVSS